MASGGAGASSGITLNVPTIFTVSAQSVVFNYSQRDYIRSAHMGVEAAELALKNVREQIEEDAVDTYVSLDSAQQPQKSMAEQSGYALRLVAIVRDRLAAGMESNLELKRVRRVAVQSRLEQLQLDDQIASLRGHLEQLTGIQSSRLETVSESVPSIDDFFSHATASFSDSPDNANVLSSEASARAKVEQAFGDSRYTWRPQLAFEAQYGRISINNISSYYNLMAITIPSASGFRFSCHFWIEG